MKSFFSVVSRFLIIPLGKRFRETLKYLFSILFIGGLLFAGSINLNYDWQWSRVPDFFFSFSSHEFHFGPLIKGLFITLEISSMSIVLAFFIALVSALMRLSSSPVAKLMSYLYIESIRNTPLLIQILFLYFVLAPIFGLSAFASAIIALSLFEGAYASEIMRAGILSIDRGQWEAAYSLGLGKFGAYRYIILPQALRRMLPPLTGQGISLVKDSALVSTISIFDLTMRGQEIISRTFLTFEIWFSVAGIYLFLTLFLSMLAKKMEKRFEMEL